MAISGGACSSIKLQIIDGQLCEFAKLYRQQSELVHDVDEAVALLARGEVVMFKTLGGNMVDLRARLGAMGIVIQEPIEAMYRIHKGL